MLTKNAEKIFKMKYSNSKQWTQAVWDIASHVASAEPKEEDRLLYAKDFFRLIHELVFIPGGRILANSTTTIKNLLNCFVLPISDSRQSIYSTLANSAEIFAYGGGIGFNISDIREEGADVTSTGGKASGPLSFLSLFDQTGEVISQASRRGAQLAVLDIDHPDIEKYIHFKSIPNSRNKRLLEEYKRNLRNVKLNNEGKKYFDVLEKTLQDDQLSHFNISVMVTDEFMTKAKENKDFSLISRKTNLPIKTINAGTLMKEVAQTAWESGDPGIIFYNRMNDDNMVKYLGDIRATNPCVVGDTKIMTVFEGNKPIKDLVGRDVLVYSWNSETKLPEVSFMRNIRKTKENSELLEVEFDSGLKVKCTPDHNFYTFRGNKIQAKDITVGQSIRAFSLSINNKDGHLRAHGWANGKVKHRYVARLIWNYINGDVPEGMIIHHIDFNKLNNSLDNLELVTNAQHNRIHYPARRDGGFFHRNHKVVSVKSLDNREDVYNGAVDNTHTYIIPDEIPLSGVGTGIVSANCGEIGLLPYEACCLGSLNLAKFVTEEGNIDFELLEFAVRRAIRFLDNVQELSSIPIKEINYYTKGLRRLGLGVMGWADMLVMLGIPYNSKKALDIANYLSWFISFFSWLESINLAEEKGVFSLYDPEKVDLSVVDKVLNSHYSAGDFNIEEIRKKGVRNVSVTSIAPTGTIALLAGVNSGIEPFFALAYRRNITEGIGNTAKDHILEINPLLIDELKKYDVPDEIIQELIEWLENGNSILDFTGKIPENIKGEFITAHELSATEHVQMQAAWQEFITNSISKTVNLPNSATVQDIEDIYHYAWLMNLKGITVYRDGSKTFQILNTGK